MPGDFSRFTARVTQGEDGVYRWYYDMDMYQNKSMLYMLEKINLFTFLGVSIGGALLIMAVEGDASFARGILLVGLALGVVFAVLGVVVARPAFVYIVNVPADYLELTLRYFRIYAVGLIFQYGYNSFSSILRAVGDSAATLYFLLIASVLNIILDLLFVAVFHWGVDGAAVATVIAQAASFVAAYIYMIRKYPIFRFELTDYRWSPPHIHKTVAIGFPISLQLMIVSLGLTLIQRAVNGFGQAMTASFTVGSRIEQYLNIPFNGFQTTLATYTGQNIGAGEMARVNKGVRQTIAVSLGMTLIVSGAVWLLADDINTLFGLSDQAAVYCLSHLRTVAMVNIILSLYVPLFGVFQGANHSGIPTVVATCALTTRVAVTYLLKDSPFLGYRIIWWNGLFGFGMGCTVSWLYYLSGRWQRGANVLK